MRAILAGFAAIWSVTAIGYLISRYGLLGSDATTVLARLAFYVATPALLFTTLSTTRPAEVFTGAFAAYLLSTAAVALGYLAVAGLWWRHPAGDVAVGTLGASYVNAANLGIPVAVYVLGDVSAVAPILLFQVLVAAPAAIAVLDVSTGDRRPSLGRLLSLPTRNPIMIASAAGLAVAVAGVRPPMELLRPFELLGAAAVPLALLALGMSLPGARPLAAGPQAGQRATAVALKVVGQPIAAYLIGRYALGLTGPALISAVVTAALPTAQNVFIFASQYQRAERLARDTIVLSTVATAVTLPLIAAWLG
ncbi:MULTISPECIES: AEC family transporter [unclassified Solwaraspora]|uniref:AEC family transporter n=1 Tax=unclassified Solwaraspora TaxID=2627926 RepID=UPI00259BA6D3|nr:AEC family transporter [Solwaraspora sp. WMMA2056]WJK39043.1 AEC family transporter [Solwaraspora sp. WMMA2056]